MEEPCLALKCERVRVLAASNGVFSSSLCLTSSDGKDVPLFSFIVIYEGIYGYIWLLVIVYNIFNSTK